RERRGLLVSRGCRSASERLGRVASDGAGRTAMATASKAVQAMTGGPSMVRFAPMFTACLGASCSPGASAGSSEGFDGGAIDSTESGSGSATSSGSSGGSSSGGVTNNDASMGTSSGGVFGDSGPCDACAPGAIYVAPNGSDTNPGTLDQPLKTLTKAKALAPLLG